MKKNTNFKFDFSAISWLHIATFLKTTKLLRRAFYATVLVMFSLAGCEEVELYSIDSPLDRQAKIDSIAAAKAAVDTGDTTFLTISTAIVGAEDNSAPWFTAFSDYFTAPIGQKLVLKFENYGTGVNNWNNWNLALASVPDRDADDYSEYFVLRSDAFGWGNGDFDLGLVSQNYPDLNGNDDIWDDFRSIMQGADVTLEIDYSVTGYVFVTATAVGTDGTELVMTYNQLVTGTQEVSAFLICDGSHFIMEDAFLLPSEVTAIEDVVPTSIDVTGAPEFVEIGNENFWGDAVATVTFADGSSAEVDSTDLSFTVVPDMTTLGEKTVIVAYSKTKQGEFTQAVSTFYNLEVSNSVASLAVTSPPDITTYYFFNSDPIILNTNGLVVTATYSDGTSSVLSNQNLLFGTIPAIEGEQTIDISFEGATSIVTTTLPLTLVQGASQVGATDLSTGFWGAHTADFTVASGESKTFKLYIYSTNVNAWNAPVAILRRADLTEYAVVRMDNFGWGDGYGTATPANDWDFDVLASNISGSYAEITVTNNGDDTADIRYDVTLANGNSHFQEYVGLTVDSSDLTTALTVDGCYLVLVE